MFRFKLSFSRPLLTVACLGLALSGMTFLGGCIPSPQPKQAVKKTPVLEMVVVQVDQISGLGKKIADGQYLVARATFKNTSNKTIVLKPADFALGNITQNAAERYAQPAEKGIGAAFAKTFGPQFKEKVMDSASTNLYPRMQLERFFVFMVPSEAVLDKYQITYTPAKISVPLVSPEVTIINDHRNDSSEPQPTQP